MQHSHRVSGCVARTRGVYMAGCLSGYYGMTFRPILSELIVEENKHDDEHVLLFLASERVVSKKDTHTSCNEQISILPRQLDRQPLTTSKTTRVISNRASTTAFTTRGRRRSSDHVKKKSNRTPHEQAIPDSASCPIDTRGSFPPPLILHRLVLSALLAPEINKCRISLGSLTSFYNNIFLISSCRHF